MATAERHPSLEDTPPFAGHSPDQERPLGGYVALVASFLGLVAAFSAWIRRSGRQLPERIAPSDLALVTVATQTTARLLTKSRALSAVRAPFTRFQGDEGPGEVMEAARGHGLRRAVGELLVCPHCVGMWLAAAFTAGLIVAPRPTRWIATVLAALFGSELLQIVYKKACDSLG
jgi:hypothetical protein